jgi:hypothetical protein
MTSLWQKLFGGTEKKVETEENVDLEKLIHDAKYRPQYPVANYVPDIGHSDVQLLEPRYFTLEQHAQKVFSQRVAQARWRFDQHWKVMGILAVTTGIMTAQKNKYALAMALPVGTVLFSWAYHYDLAYGGMIKRVNQECQHIATQEGKSKYFLSDEDVTKNAQEAAVEAAKHRKQ